MDLIGAGFRRDLNNGAVRAAVLRTKLVRERFELLDSFDCEILGWSTNHLVAVVGTVHQHCDVSAAATSDTNTIAKCRTRAIHNRRRPCARQYLDQSLKVAIDHRQVLDFLQTQLT